jgi:hypothetical protein
MWDQKKSNITHLMHLSMGLIFDSPWIFHVIFYGYMNFVIRSMDKLKLQMGPLNKS